MDDTLHLETEFEKYITRKLKGLSDSGEWMVSDNDAGYDRAHAIYFPDFVEFQRRLDPDKLAKMQERLGSSVWLPPWKPTERFRRSAKAFLMPDSRRSPAALNARTTR